MKRQTLDRVFSGTIVKWRNQIAETDQRLYHYSKLVADQYNSTKQKRRTNIYVHIIAHLIVRYHLTLEQAITLSGYKIAPARVSTLLSKSIEKEFYQQVKAVLNDIMERGPRKNNAKDFIRY